MKKIKILYTINYLNTGGPSKVLLNMIKSIDKIKYDVSILTIIDQNDEDIVKILENEGVHIIRFNLRKKISDVLKFKKKIIKKINEIKPNIIHTHGIVTSFLVASKKINCFKVTTIHSDVFADYKFTYGNIKGPIITYLHLMALKKFNEIICCSKSTYDVIKEKFNNIKYIRNGIDSDFKENPLITKKLLEELNIKKSDVVFIYVGVITKRKRVLELVKMFNEHYKNNEKLLVVGNGELYQEIKKYENENIKILGYKSNPLDYMAVSDIYISNSSSEGLSISIIEALELGLGLLVSNIPSHKEIFLIDNNYYIGEIFNEDNFKNKKDKVVKSKFKNISDFKNKYLSSNAMMKEYEKVYSRWKV